MSSGVDEQAPADLDVAPQQTAPQSPPDRWAWRGRIRSNPHQLRLYRVVVGVLGLLLILLGLATGWLPGPGGIPLVLLGLAVWSSEFGWAHRLMLRLKHGVAVFRSWSTGRKVAAWAVVLGACALLGWGYLAVVGPPAWVPMAVDRVLDVLPGVRIPG